MDEELRGLLEQAKGVTSTPTEIAESDLRMAVANGMISDDRVTIEALHAVQVVNRARTRQGVKEIA